MAALLVGIPPLGEEAANRLEGRGETLVEPCELAAVDICRHQLDSPRERGVGVEDVCDIGEGEALVESEGKL